MNSKRLAKDAPDAPSALADLLPDVTPIAKTNRAEIERELPPPVAEQRLRDDREALAESLALDDPWEAGLEKIGRAHV